MVVQVHGFDWAAYTEHIMPAFEQWFIQRDESAVYRLFKETRCAREESFIPAALQRARIWPRAQAFVETLPLGPYSRREYQKLCSAENFTALSDRYMYKHAPQLYQNPEPIRAVWGALIETYCLPWGQNEQRQTSEPLMHEVDVEEFRSPLPSEQVERGEVLSLLREAGLGELAREMGEEMRSAADRPRETGEILGPDTQPLAAERARWRTDEIDLHYGEDAFDDEMDDEDDGMDEYTRPMPGGVMIGAHPNPLQLRGWLAGISVRAQALFEFLACGRRNMPFGYEPSEPYGVFIGYLTPDEVWRLGICLRNTESPDQSESEADYLRFRYQHPGVPESYRLIDEVLPSYATEFHQAVDMAAAQGLGLICSIE